MGDFPSLFYSEERLTKSPNLKAEKGIKVKKYCWYYCEKVVYLQYKITTDAVAKILYRLT